MIHELFKSNHRSRAYLAGHECNQGRDELVLIECPALGDDQGSRLHVGVDPLLDLDIRDEQLDILGPGHGGARTENVLEKALDSELKALRVVVELLEAREGAGCGILVAKWPGREG